jgi:multiple sugar transport system permease protein/raffinose/stachyose/melibiose transport system permease protein
MTVLALTMIPNVLTLVPSFVLTIKLHLNNTYPGVWLPIAAGGQASQIIVLRTFFASVPQELFDSARIDGAGEIRILWGIVLPLAKPILSTLIVLDAMSIWNEYIWPMMVLSDPTCYPLMLQILRLVQDQQQTDPGGMFAAYTLASLPLFILFAFTSRAFIRGLTSGAVKM